MGQRGARSERGTGHLGPLSVFVALLFLSGCAAFKFVYIPCEQSLEMEEWSLAPKSQEDEIGCLTNHLQLWFGKTGLTQAQKRAFKEHVRMHLKQRNPAEKTEELLDGASGDPRIAAMSDKILTTESVEIVTVLPPQSQFGYVTISMYVDDKGVARNLAVNHRATSLLETVSTRAGPVLGDAFVASSYDNEMGDDGFRRLDFGLAAISSSAGWIKVCQQQKMLSLKNHDKMKEQMVEIKNQKTSEPSPADKTRMNLVELERKDEAEAARDESNPLLRDGYHVFPAMQLDLESASAFLSAAVELREKGNTFYNQKAFDVALRKYAKARRYLMHSYFIAPSPDDPIDEALRSQLLIKTELNLALAAFHVPRPAQCEEVCRAILSREPSNLKALYRLGSCQRDFGDIEVARATFAKGCDIAPGDASMRRGLRGCDAKLRRDQAATFQLASKMFGKGLGSLYPTIVAKSEEDRPGQPSREQLATGFDDEEDEARHGGLEEGGEQELKEGGQDGDGGSARNAYGDDRPWKGMDGDGQEVGAKAL